MMQGWFTLVTPRGGGKLCPFLEATILRKPTEERCEGIQTLAGFAAGQRDRTGLPGSAHHFQHCQMTAVARADNGHRQQVHSDRVPHVTWPFWA